MAKIPFMPFYGDDFLADTAHLDAAQTGGYMCLIIHYWKNGRIPEDDRFLARIARMGEKQWRANREVILAFFDDDLKHKRIEKELNKAHKKTGQSRSAAAIRWGKAKAEKVPHDPSLRAGSKVISASEQNNGKSLKNNKTGDADAYNSHMRTDMPTQNSELRSKKDRARGLELDLELIPDPTRISSSEIGEKTPVRTPPKYASDFEEFWKAFPTDPNMSKKDAGAAWLKLSPADKLAAMAAVPLFVQYCRADPTYRPVHAVRFITQRRFDGYAGITQISPTQGGHLSAKSSSLAAAFDELESELPKT